MQADVALEGEPARSDDSLERRYAWKLLSNAAALCLGLVSQAIVPRALGPAALGSYSFLTSFFTQWVNFLESDSSTGFLVKVAQRPRDAGLVRFYWGVLGLVAATTLVVTGGSLLAGFGDAVWPAQESRFVGLAAVVVLSTLVCRVVGNLVDAHGLTVRAERVRVGHRFVLTCVLGALWLGGWFGLVEYFLYQLVFALTLSVAWSVVLRRAGVEVLPREPLGSLRRSEYRGELLAYSRPMFLYSLAWMFSEVFDRWLLQVCAGSVQQGFYGLSWQLQAMQLFFPSAFVPLLTREFARAHASQDDARIRHLFSRSIPLFTSIATYFSVFLAVQAPTVVRLFGGRAFDAAAPVVTIMALSPIATTVGQLSSTRFFATGQTRLYSRVGIVVAIVFVPVTYVMVAPRDRHGLELGATGVALKLVAAQITAYAVHLWLHARQLRISYVALLAQLVLPGVVLAALAVAASHAVGIVLERPLAAFLASGVLYTLASAAALALAPSLFATTRMELAQGLRRLRERLRWGGGASRTA